MKSQTSASSSRPRRPDGITIIAGYVVIGGMALALHGLFHFPNPSNYVIFFLLLGIFFLNGRGLWEGKRWALKIYPILVLFNIIVSLIIFDSTFARLLYLIGLRSLQYMSEPHVQRFFGMKIEPTNSATPSPYTITNPYTGKSPEDLESELKKLEENLQWLESQKEKGIIADEIYTQIKTEYTQKIEEIKKHLSH
ncbi:MAG: hypothetical protein LM573_04575 [Thermofilum sp.]|nr:hypothetical protein [Thermofilum sp.]